PTVVSHGDDRCRARQPMPTGQPRTTSPAWPRSADPRSAERRAAVITGITEIAHITTKQDMSRWTRAHADVPGITWSVLGGARGTMIIVEHTEDRCSLNRANIPPNSASALPALAASP